VRIGGVVLVSTLVGGVSALGAIAAFVAAPAAWERVLAPLQDFYVPWRLINTYHLFGHITRERIEPEFQVETPDGWRAVDLRYKPGDVRRAPRIVAPHQPRVDFQLWFYGLGFQRGMPAYVSALIERLCNDPAAVQPLFVEPLPAKPSAVRIVFWRYRFAPPGEREAWWTREQIALTRPLVCTASLK